jgi:hypothetical protein
MGHLGDVLGGEMISGFGLRLGHPVRLVP